ncbi:SDR family NAD(P)-dependent oxidoreductase [Nocardia sp. ET3-3]|uniref:SDR family NAD(P)-dependent oxidoreductase n=1 Tax=Nocardia terrae TaxID=2675851 RepID=A0A7K1V555_9NOCA|nr:SDR family oxidoreductase [Nocardia terrae]MVU81783.1 SDR family NAD(P)-dependent oxidoreductase [Nocardia terrae]
MTVVNAPLADRIAVVTGASSGIGAATARRLAADGARVALLARRVDRIKELAAEISGLAVEADVRLQDSVLAAARTVRGELGRPDLVVANAGVMLPAPFDTSDTAEWDQMISTNVNGLLYTSRAFADDLLAAAAEGRTADLVHVSSIGAHVVFANYGVYGATKAAVSHLSRILRAEFGPRGLRVHNLEPGLVTTELGDTMEDRGQFEALAEWRERNQSLPATDIADIIAFSTALPRRVNIADLVVLPTVQG